MTGPRPFRFGVVSATAASGAAWADRARHIESLGYATLLVPDGLKYTLAPMPALAAAAAATRSLRLGTYVIANDYRSPVMLAKEAASLDVLSDGRLELGIGAGRPDAADDVRMLGGTWASGRVRLARLADSVALLKRLLGGAGEIGPSAVQRPHPPLLIAAAGPEMLALAAREADIIALGVPPTATEADVAARVDLIRGAAGARFAQIELNLNLMAVGERVPSWIGRTLKLSAADLARVGAAPALVGSVDEMCATLERRRTELGISYIAVSDELMDDFAPVVARLAGR